MATTEDVFVLDSSVLVELVADGRHLAGADALLDRVETERPPTLVTAAHGIVEALNAIRRLEARGWIAGQAAHGAVEELRRFPLVVDDPAPRVSRIWSLRQSMSAYDAAYAAAAEALEAPLLTVDARLLRACQARGIPAIHLDDLAA